MIRRWRMWRLRAWERRLQFAQIRMDTFKENEDGWDPQDRKYRRNMLEHHCAVARFEVESRKAMLWPDPKLLAPATVQDDREATP